MKNASKKIGAVALSALLISQALFFEEPASFSDNPEIFAVEKPVYNLLNDEFERDILKY